MSRGTIYLILNKQNGHKYVGNTTLAMNKEWAHHIDRSKRMSSEPLHKAFRDLGVHNFMIKELDACDESLLEEKTNYWIKQYKPEYNPINVEKDEESMQVLQDPVPVIIKEKRKISSPHLTPWNEHTRGNGKKLGLKIRGKNLETGLCKDYESAREAAVDVTGVPNTNGNILNAARTGIIAYGHRWQIMEEKSKKKPVFGVNKKTELIEVRFESINAAVRELGGTDKNSILRSLKNPGRYSWKGYYWFFASS